MFGWTHGPYGLGRRHDSGGPDGRRDERDRWGEARRPPGGGGRGPRPPADRSEGEHTHGLDEGDAERTLRLFDTEGERVARRDEAVRAAVEQGLLGPGNPVVALLDVTGIRASAAALRRAFDAVTAPGTPVLHAFAVKATPLVPVLRLLREAGIGAEVASAGELALARAAGVPPKRTVLDSPAKTPAELREALALGIAVNADNPQELDRIDALVRSATTRSPSASG